MTQDPSTIRPAGAASAEDVALAYRFFLGRDPESEASLRQKVGLDWLALINDFLVSAEFLVRVRDRILSRAKPTGDHFDSPPGPALCGWVARRMPLREPSRDRVITAADWIDLFCLVFNDEAFRLAMEPTATLRSPFLDHLAALRSDGGRQSMNEPSLLPKWVLVTGAPRSGTSLLRAMLDRHPNVALLQEYGLTALIDRIDAIVGRSTIQDVDWSEKDDADDARFAQVAAYYRTHPARELDRTIGEGQFSHRDFHAVALGVLSAIAPGKTLHVVGDKMPMSEPWEDVPRLVARLQGLKFVVVIRNPAEVVKSSLIRRAATERGRDAWPVRTVQEAAAHWVRAWHLTQQLKACYSDAVYVVKYEDLCADPARSMASIDAFLGISTHLPDIAVAVRPAALSLLSPAENAVLNRLLGPIIATWASLPPHELLRRYVRLPSPYVFGNIVRFDHEGAGSCFVQGFANPGSLGRWTDKRQACIELLHGETTGIIFVEIWLSQTKVNDDGLCDLLLEAGGEPKVFTFGVDGGRAAIAARAGDARHPGTVTIELTVAGRADAGEARGVCVKALRATHLVPAQRTKGLHQWSPSS